MPMYGMHGRSGPGWSGSPYGWPCLERSGTPTSEEAGAEPIQRAAVGDDVWNTRDRHAVKHWKIGHWKIG
jgi:hypothetical protein